MQVSDGLHTYLVAKRPFDNDRLAENERILNACDIDSVVVRASTGISSYSSQIRHWRRQSRVKIPPGTRDHRGQRGSG